MGSQMSQMQSRLGTAKSNFPRRSTQKVSQAIPQKDKNDSPQSGSPQTRAGETQERPLEDGNERPGDRTKGQDTWIPEPKPSPPVSAIYNLELNESGRCAGTWTS